MSTGKECTDNELCTYHNLQCAYPDCAYGRAQKAQTAKTHEVAARIRVAEAAVVEAAEAYVKAKAEFESYVMSLYGPDRIVEDQARTSALADAQWETQNALTSLVRALHWARQGVQHGA